MKKTNASLTARCNRWVLAIAVVLLLVATAAMIWFAYTRSGAPPEATFLPDRSRTSSLGETKRLVNTVPIAQQSRTEIDTVDVDDVSESLIDPFSVQSLLYEIEFDENGNVVVDDKARRLLERSVFVLGQNQGQSSLDLLDQMIRAGLPGSEGEQVADIFRRYYEYKSAESEFIAAVQVDGSGAAEVVEQLRHLRQGYLGYELTHQLFAEEEAYLKKAIMLMEQAETEANVDH